MSDKAWFYTLVLVGTALEVVGDMLFKRWVGDGRTATFAWGLAIYILGAVLWAASLRYGPLAKAAVVFALANTLVLCLGGFILFEERLGTAQVVGIGLALVSMAVLETSD